MGKKVFMFLECCVRELKRIVTNRKFFFWLVYLGLNIVVALQIPCAQISPDEIIPLSLSAKIAGYDWGNIAELYHNYYGYIQCILYVPFFLFIKDGVILYKTLLCFNSLLISFIPILAWKTVANISDTRDKKIQLLVVAMSSLQPAYLNLSKRAWNETMVMLLIWGVVYLLSHLLVKEGKSIGKSIQLGMIVALGYALHGRFLAIILALFFTDMISRILYKKAIYSRWYYIVLVLGIMLNSLVKPIIYVLLWEDSDILLRNTLGETISRLVQEGLSVTSIHDILRAFSGNFFYLTVASLGIIGMGVTAIYKIIKQSCLQKEKCLERISLLGIFVYICTFTAMGIASMFFMSDYQTSNEFFYIYGRYTEYLVGPMILVVMLAFLKVNFNNVELITGIGIFLISSLYTFLLEQKEILEKVWVHLNVYTLQAFSPNYSLTQTEYNFAICICIYCVIFLLFVCLLKKKLTKAAAFLCVVYIGIYLSTAANALIKDSRVIWTRIENVCEKLSELYEIDNNLFAEYEIGISQADSTSLQIAVPYGRFMIFNQTDVIENEMFIVNSEGLPKVENYDSLYFFVDGIDSILVYGQELANLLRERDIEIRQVGYGSNERIYFNNNVGKKYYEIKNWYNYEDWGMWSQGDESTVSILFEEQFNVDMRCIMDLSTFYNEKEIDIYADDIYITSVVASPEVISYVMNFPKSVFEDGCVEIKFMINSQVFSPSDVIDSSNDERLLGVGLHTIEFENK